MKKLCSAVHKAGLFKHFICPPWNLLCANIKCILTTKQYLVARNIIWIHWKGESLLPLANTMVIDNNEGFLHILATLPGVLVLCVGMAKLRNCDLSQAPFVQPLPTHRNDFPVGIFGGGFAILTNSSGVDISFPDMVVLVVKS